MTYADLNHIEFDTVFEIVEGKATERRDLYAPTVWHDETEDVSVDSGEPWEPLTGWTGQYSYAGACMHQSEVFAGPMAQHVLDTPGTYVLVVVQVMPTDDDEDPEPAGWAVLRLKV